MKRLDLSCLPLKLDVGEVMEVIDHEGKYHLIKCVQSKKMAVAGAKDVSSLKQLKTLVVLKSNVRKERGNRMWDI